MTQISPVATEEPYPLFKGHSNPTNTMAMIIALNSAKNDYERGKMHEAFRKLDRAISLVDPTHFDINLIEAVNLVLLIGKEENKVQLPSRKLALYNSIQLQQFQALYDLQVKLIEDNNELLADLKWYEYLTYTAFTLFSIFLIIGFLYAKDLRKKTQMAVKDKDDFVGEQLKNYDEKILRMLIMNSRYEEIKAKLKNEFGLDDDDFKPDS